MNLKNRKFMLISIGSTLLLLLFFILITFEKKNDLHIALVCPLSGEYALEGKSLLNGVRLYIDDLNEKGGVSGKKIVLDVFDDKNDPATAKEKALEIVGQGRAAAVIGHYDSSCSFAAGNVYKKNGIPAITPSSIHTNVTPDNDWYFRNINNSNLQGRFFANYFKVFIGPETKISIIYEKHPYGIGLAKSLEQACHDLNIDIKYLKGFPPDGEFRELILQDIVEEELASIEDPGIIFLATRASAGVTLVKLLRDAGIRNLLGGPDAFGSKIFWEGFRSSEMEKLYPGYYTNQIFVFSSLLFDSANEKAQKFRENYRARYEQEPESVAAFAYDAAMIMAEALKNAEIQEKKDSIKDAREKVRDYIANRSNIACALEGVSGFNYFDENGDAQKEIYIGLYKSNQLISTFNQIRNIHYLNEIADVEKELEDGDIVIVDDKYMYKNSIVKTGVKFNDISEIDMKAFVCKLDFNIWFRYQGNIEAQDIVFENAVEPILLKEPMIEKTDGYDMYRLYHVKGKFKIDSFPDRYAFGRHVLGIRFHHRLMTQNKLIYVTDSVGMGLLNGTSPTEKMKKTKVISPAEGWSISKVRFFGDTSEEAPQGRPEYLNLIRSAVEHSAFNAWIKIKDDSFTLRGIIPFKYSKYIMLICGLSILLSVFVAGNINIKRYAKYIWVFRLIMVTILLLTSEIYIINMLIDKMNNYQLTLFTRAFGMLYWIAAAFFMCRAVNYFAWMPLESRTGRKIPDFLRRFITSVIYLLAVIGITAFVFDQKVSGLLATSGVFAMIIGLAVQMNISNVFSGIAINMERPLQIGDWVNIGEFEEGEVEDITWRTTRIRTRDGCILSVPNSVASESVIKNYNYPNDVYELWFPIHIDPIHPPEQIEKILLDAALSVDVVLREPYPVSRLSGGLRDWAAKYYLVACVKDRSQMNIYNGIIWKSILTHLHQAGITPARRQEIHVFQGTAGPEKSKTIFQIVPQK